MKSQSTQHFSSHSTTKHYDPSAKHHCEFCRDTHHVTDRQDLGVAQCYQCPTCRQCNGLLSEAGKGVLSACEPGFYSDDSGWCDHDCLRKEVESQTHTAVERFEQITDFLDGWNESEAFTLEGIYAATYAALVALRAYYALQISIEAEARVTS